MSAKKDFQQMMKMISRHPGVEIVRSNSNHLKVYLDGRMITVLPYSPSDCRAYKNSISILKKAGVI